MISMDHYIQNSQKLKEYYIEYMKNKNKNNSK